MTLSVHNNGAPHLARGIGSIHVSAVLRTGSDSASLPHYSAPVGKPSIVTSRSVCVFVVCLFASISPELAQSSPNLFARVTYGRDSVLGLSIRNDVKHGWNSNGRRGRDGG